MTPDIVDMQVILDGLADAITYRTECGDADCADCEHHVICVNCPGDVCPDCKADLDRAARYREARDKLAANAPAAERNPA